MPANPRDGVFAPSLPQSSHVDADSRKVPLRDVHPLQRVRALRELARRAGLDRIAVEIVTTIALRTDANGVTMVGQTRIAAESGYGARTVWHRLRLIERAGLFQRRRSGPRGLTTFTFVDSVPAGVVDQTRQRAQQPPVSVAPHRANVGRDKAKERTHVPARPVALREISNRCLRAPVPMAALTATVTSTPTVSGQRSLETLRAWRASAKALGTPPGIASAAPYQSLG